MLSKASQYFGIGFVLVAVGAVAACSSSDSGTTTTTTGGSTAKGGTGGAGTTTGGTGTGTTGGTGTGTTGGTGTTTGGTSAGGSGGAGTAPTCVAPTASTITSFADLVANATSAGNFTFTAGISGGTYTYAPAELTLADSGMALHVTGTVKNYDGFGIYLKCADATAYTGVSFNIKGNVGPTAMMSFRIHTYSDTPSTDSPPGGCVVPAGTTDTYPVCHAAAKEFPVPAAGGVVNILFTDLAAGIPVATVTPKEINGLEWAFDYTPPAAGAGGAGGAAAGGATSYAADVTIDDVKFTGGTGPQGAGGTGAGGTGAGGTGGTGGTGGSAGTAGSGGRSGGGGTGGV